MYDSVWHEKQIQFFRNKYKLAVGPARSNRAKAELERAIYLKEHAIMMQELHDEGMLELIEEIKAKKDLHELKFNFILKGRAPLLKYNGKGFKAFICLSQHDVVNGISRFDQIENIAKDYIKSRIFVRQDFNGPLFGEVLFGITADLRLIRLDDCLDSSD